MKSKNKDTWIDPKEIDYDKLLQFIYNMREYLEKKLDKSQKSCYTYNEEKK